MVKDFNEIKELITSWGLPEKLKHKKNDIIFEFEDSRINVTKESGYEVKFYLYDKESEKIIFKMDFNKSSLKMRELKNYNRLKLDLLCVNAAYRNKRIATYYVDKLIKFAIQEKFNYILVIPDSDADIFKDDCKKYALNKKQLRDFYTKKSTKEMPIKFP